MVETSLAEIFAGDVPRIDNMVIVQDPNDVAEDPSLLSASAQSAGGYLVWVNMGPDMLKWAQQYFARDNLAILVRTEVGFEVKCGDIPEYFQGEFNLGYRVSFKEDALPKNERILNQVNSIKGFQAELDRGWVGHARYGINGNLWARVRGLNEMVQSPD